MNQDQTARHEAQSTHRQPQEFMKLNPSMSCDSVGTSLVPLDFRELYIASNSKVEPCQSFDANDAVRNSASTTTLSGTPAFQHATGSTKRTRPHDFKIPRRHNISPQEHLDNLIYARGYSTMKHNALDTGYYSKPTQLQLASHHVNLIKLARECDEDKLRKILTSGVSPNPCNVHGESLLHTVARFHKPEIMQVMLDAGATIQVLDDYGRCPLHDACWRAEPNFEMVELIADIDVTLFHLTDKRGSTPLSYVLEEAWPAWIQFIDSKIESWWSMNPSSSSLLRVAPNSNPVPDPANALTFELTKMVVSGRITPAEAQMLNTIGVRSDRNNDEGQSTSSDNDTHSSTCNNTLASAIGDDDFCIIPRIEMDEMLDRISSAKVS